MLTYYMDLNTSDDLKSKAKKAMNEIIKKCSNLTALEPLLHVASKEILKNVLGQFVTYLKGKKELATFARNGGLQKVLVLRTKMKENLLYTEEDKEEEKESPTKEEQQEEEGEQQEVVKPKRPIPILELKTKAAQLIVQLAEEIMSYYPEEIVNYYSPEDPKLVIDKIGKEDSKQPEPPKEEEKKEEENKNVKGKPDDKDKVKGKIPSAKKKPTK